jgi:hypothetical protein
VPFRQVGSLHHGVADAEIAERASRAHHHERQCRHAEVCRRQQPGEGDGEADL